MKLFGFVLILLLIFISLIGCNGNTLDVENPLETDQDGESSGTEPVVTIDLNGPENAQSSDEIKIFTIGFLEFYFDMQLSAALEVLDNCDIEYETGDDTSTIRSWAGTCVAAKGLSLYFDIDEKLHEIRISGEQKTNLPVKIGDLVSDITNDLGETEEFYSPEYPPGAVATLSSEYDMGSYYLRTVFAGERIPPENYAVWEIFVSKYSRQEYENTQKSAKLALTNTDGSKAELYIGMTKKDAVETLEMNGIPYEQSENVSNLVNGEMLLGQGPTVEDDAFEGYSFSIYFDWNGRISTVYAMGSGVYTSKGLATNDYFKKGSQKTDMIAMYGEDYYERPLENEDYHIYRYKEESQYLYVCTSIYDSAKEEITGLYISRYTGARALK